MLTRAAPTIVPATPKNDATTAAEVDASTLAATWLPLMPIRSRAAGGVGAGRGPASPDRGPGGSGVGAGRGPASPDRGPGGSGVGAEEAVVVEEEVMVLWVIREGASLVERACDRTRPRPKTNSPPSPSLAPRLALPSLGRAGRIANARRRGMGHRRRFRAPTQRGPDAKNGTLREDPVRRGQPGGRGGRADRHPAPSWPVPDNYPAPPEHKPTAEKVSGEASDQGIEGRARPPRAAVSPRPSCRSCSGGCRTRTRTRPRGASP